MPSVMVRYACSGFLLRSHQCIYGIRYISKINHHAVLKVSPDASVKEIKDAYIKLSKEYHPDSNQNNSSCHEEFVKIKESYDVLISLHRRSADDKIRSQQWSHNIHRHRNNNRQEEKNQNSKKEADFSQFREEQTYDGRLKEIILAIMVVGTSVFIIHLISNIIRTVKKKQDSKFPKNPRNVTNLDNEIEEIMKKDRSEWDEMDRYLVKIYIQLYHKKDGIQK